jgi:hypothetical protein
MVARPRPRQRLSTTTARRLVLEWLEVFREGPFGSFTLRDITRGVDHRLVEDGDPRLARLGLLRITLDQLVDSGEVYSRRALPSEIPTDLRGGGRAIRMYSLQSTMPETDYERRSQHLKYLPRSREELRETNGDSGDGPGRATLLVTLVQELARDADDVGNLRRENERLAQRVAQLERELEEVEELRRQLKVVEKARVLLQTLEGHP